MAIMMALVTTFIILSILFFFEESNLGWAMLVFVSTVGYLVSAMYYDTYRKTKNIG